MDIEFENISDNISDNYSLNVVNQECTLSDLVITGDLSGDFCNGIIDSQTQDNKQLLLKIELKNISKYIGFIQNINEEIYDKMMMLSGNIFEPRVSTLFQQIILFFMKKNTSHNEKEIIVFKEKIDVLIQYFKTDDLFFNAGFEYTFHYQQTGFDFSDLQILLNKRLEGCEISKIYEDFGVFEIVTKPYGNLNNTFRDFIKIFEVTKQYKLVPYIKNKGGGGLHINLDIKKFEHANYTYLNLIRFIHNFPQLNWIFNEPSDIRTANSLYFLKEKKEVFFDLQKAINCICSKSKSIRFCENYFELRFFEMPHNIEEFKNIISFLRCVLNECFKYAQNGQLFPLIYREIDSIGKEVFFSEEPKVFLEEFYELLNEFGLKKNMFDALIERNFKERVRIKTKLV